MSSERTAISFPRAMNNHDPEVQSSETESIEPPRKSAFFETIFRLVGRRETWSPARVLRVSWGALANVGNGLRILKLLRLRAFAGLVQDDPRFTFKCLVRDYLARDSSVSARMACFFHHYRRLHAGMSTDLLQQVLHKSVPVLESQEGKTRFTVTLCFSRPFEKEGELTLNLYVDDAVVFVISFTIVPGWAVDSNAEDVLLISRIQGTKGFYREISLATKAFHNVGPASLLFAALQGVACAFGVNEIAAVSSARQSSYTEELSVFYKGAYDDFFSDLGVASNASGFFICPIPMVDKPLASIKQGHKIRTREKRAFKLKITQEVFQALSRGVTARVPGPSLAGLAFETTGGVDSERQ